MELYYHPIKRDQTTKNNKLPTYMSESDSQKKAQYIHSPEIEIQVQNNFLYKLFQKEQPRLPIPMLKLNPFCF